MKPIDFWILMGCCLAWATNFTVSAWVLGAYPVPPFMLAAVRAVIVLIIMGYMLFRPRPQHLARLLIVCACVGPIHLGFLYSGLQTAPASGSSIVSQMLIPFAAVLSMIFLGEKIGWRRGLAILGALIGLVIMVYEPGALSADIGLLYIVFAYLSLAVGSVVMKFVGDIDWKQYVAWMAVVILICAAPVSFIFETGQAQVWAEAKVPLLIAASYAAIFTSILAHGQYFNLIRKYDVTQVVPMTLMVTVFACILGVVFLKETLYARYIWGAVFILPCVLYIALRKVDGGKAPEVLPES